MLGYLETRLSINDIGRELYISRNTVKTHVRSIYQKLGVQNRLQAQLWRQGEEAPGSE